MVDLPSTFAATRASLHAVAEHVLGAACYDAARHIGLDVVPGGFATPPFTVPAGERTVAVIDDELVVTTDGDVRRSPLTTIAELAALADVAPGAPEGLYPPATPLEPDQPLDVDAASSRVLSDWFALGDAALHVLRDELADQSPSEVQLWPEHFDDAFEAGQVNYGASPGDEDHLEPYLYVGPWTPRSGPFWNEPFGASCPWSAIGSIDDALAFLHEGTSRL